MEASAAADPFASEGTPPPAAATEDPFASTTPASDLEPTTTGDVAAEVAAEPSVAEEQPPVVNKEGERVEAPGVPATATAAGRAAAAQADAAAPAAAEAPEEPQEAPQAPEQPQEAPEPQASGDGAEEPPTPPAPAAAPAPDPEASEGKELRLYKLLYQTAENQWTEADLANVPEELKKHVGKDPKDTANKDGLFLLARNNDHARRLAFSMMGRPEAGVTVELVARTSWKPVRLAVAPPEPSRERLVIS